MRCRIHGLVAHAIFSLLAISFAAVSATEPRVWLDDQGREVRASFEGMEADGQSVRLKLEDGRIVPFPFTRLSQDCQAFAKEAAQPAPGNPQFNFDSPWPDIIGFREDPEIEIISEDTEAREFIYESMNFRYVCDVRLNRSVVHGFAMLFEATHAYCKAIPLGLCEGDRTDGKYLIKLFENREDYIKAGAPPTSAGVFMGGRNLIMVPLVSVGVEKRASSYALDRSVSNRTLAHEIVHQLTPREYRAGRQFNAWFIEGIAEYVCTTPYRAGQYNTRLGRKAAVDYATGFSKADNRGRNIGTEIQIPSLQGFMEMPYAEFVGSNANFTYAVGLLLTYYFIHLEGEGDAANLKAYLRALLESKGKDEAHAILLNGRTFKELEADVQRAWRRHGVRFHFGS